MEESVDEWRGISGSVCTLNSLQFDFFNLFRFLFVEFLEEQLQLR